MRQTLFLLAISILITSCATIMNQPYRSITVHTTQPGDIIFKKDTIKTRNNKANFKVERKNEPISIVATTDSLTKSFEVEQRNSFEYWANIFTNYGIGMLVDKKNPRRYGYPKHVYINSADTISKYYSFSQENKKGGLYLHLSLPHINSFRLTPEGEKTKINTGFWGLAIGLDYYHSESQFINLGVSGVTDFFVPVPGSIDIRGEYELLSSRYISFSNNHRIKRFTIGYGLSYSRNTWDYKNYGSIDSITPKREPVKKSNYSFGLVFPAYFQLGDHFNIGIIYRPSFYRPGSSPKFLYEHLISMDFAWKIRLKK